MGYPILLYGEGAEDVTLKKTTNRLNFQSVVVFTGVQIKKAIQLSGLHHLISF